MSSVFLIFSRKENNSTKERKQQCALRHTVIGKIETCLANTEFLVLTAVKNIPFATCASFVSVTLTVVFFRGLGDDEEGGSGWKRPDFIFFGGGVKVLMEQTRSCGIYGRIDIIRSILENFPREEYKHVVIWIWKFVCVLFKKIRAYTNLFFF